MHQMKYIMHDISGLEEPVIFSLWSHKEMANMLSLANTNIVSAGMITISESGAYCYGLSTTLFKSARKEDSKIVNKVLGFDD